MERKEGWTLAEQDSEACLDGVQRLVNQVDWDADAVGEPPRERLRHSPI
ncbi:hypothetical protein QFZ66_000170 [Streptomyces sp. B4I13]|nr:hypothetical protein [Streptomyces sp. B4I13]MDQ0956292.1 hypothetical protein [Streptomyces sp. B4I13]